MSCSNDSPRKDFLEFYIGMSESEFEKVKDSLIQNKILRPAKYTGGIYQGKNLGEPYSFYYKLHLKDYKIDLESYYTIEEDELISIRFTYGFLRVKRFDDGRWENYMGASNNTNAQLLNLYTQKYGLPDYVNEDGKYMEWYKGDLMITLRQKIKDPTVEYSYSKDYERKRNKRIRAKINKEALDII